MSQDPPLFSSDLQARRATLQGASQSMADAEATSQMWPELYASLSQVVPVALRRWRSQLKRLPATIWPEFRLRLQQGWTTLQAAWLLRHPRVLWRRANNARMRLLVDWRRRRSGSGRP